MKRPVEHSSIKQAFGTYDIKKDLTEKQLAAIGAMALAYNELEASINLLFSIAIAVPSELAIEVGTRINGSEGKTAVIRKAASISGMSPSDQGILNEALATFSEFKIYRDAVIHTRVFHAPIGIGLTLERKAKFSEVLISEAALTSAYDHMFALKRQIEVAHVMLLLINKTKNLAAKDKESSGVAIRDYGLQFHDHHKKRRLLPPIPKFPSESELYEAETRWLEERRAELMAAASGRS